jgi:hypothetical protein
VATCSMTSRMRSLAMFRPPRNQTQPMQPMQTPLARPVASVCVGCVGCVP